MERAGGRGSAASTGRFTEAVTRVGGRADLAGGDDRGGLSLAGRNQTLPGGILQWVTPEHSLHGLSIPLLRALNSVGGPHDALTGTQERLAVLASVCGRACPVRTLRCCWDGWQAVLDLIRGIRKRRCHSGREVFARSTAPPDGQIPRTGADRLFVDRDRQADVIRASR